MDDDRIFTLLALGISVAAILLSIIMQRRPRHAPRGWVPWNGLLFVAIMAAAIALAHLFGVRQR